METLAWAVLALLVGILVNQWAIQRDLKVIRARLDKGAPLSEGERMQAEESA